MCMNVIVRWNRDLQSPGRTLQRNSRRLASLRFSHLAEEDGAEQEDGVEEKQAQTQPAIQLPAVQVDTRHLRAKSLGLEG